MLRPASALVPLAAALLLGLTGCDGSGNGTSISINSSDADGNTVAMIDGNTGGLSINAPGFSGKLKIPKLHLDAGDFNINGVHLYPGSTISGMNVDAHDQPGNDDQGRVRVSFESPASTATVRDWFQQKFKAAGFTVTANDTGLSGKTDDDKDYTLNLAADGADKSKGTMTVSGS